MSDPIITQKEPYEIELEAGTYWWCACGKSKDGAFCDGSHKGGEHSPVEFTVAETGKVWLCGCRHSGGKPFCDGSHKAL